MRRTLIALLAAGVTATAASAALAQDFGASLVIGPQGVVGASLVTGYSQTYAPTYGHPQPYAGAPAYYPPNHPGVAYPPVTYRPPVHAGPGYGAPVHAAPVYQPQPYYYRPAPVVVVPAYGYYGYRHHRHHGGHPHHGWR
ncbi:MAG: hypothetical protein NTV19_19045 [Burkholderiales bacterium]|nr:hypothetical protein [Burkholderiales bacterium]